MKSSKALRYAQQVLAIRRQIVTDHVRQRTETAVAFVQARETVSRHQLAVAQHRLGMIESLARARQLTPPKPVDPIRDIVKRNARSLAQLEARSSLRAEIGHQLRAEAAQAALDRATFIQQVKRDLPEELWDESISEYDRRVYEGGEDGGS
ncbi:MAG: hypothetical protein AB1644_08365 [Candidatus Zixiibacteriota bacterium]